MRDGWDLAIGDRNMRAGVSSPGHETEPQEFRRLSETASSRAALQLPAKGDGKAYKIAVQLLSGAHFRGEAHKAHKTPAAVRRSALLPCKPQD